MSQQSCIVSVSAAVDLILTHKLVWTHCWRRRCLPPGLVGLGAQQDINFGSYTLLDNELTMCDVSSIDELCDGSGWSGQWRRGRGRHPWAWSSAELY